MEYGNLAYKLPEEYEARGKRVPQKKNRNTERRKKEQMPVKSKNLRRICLILTVSLSAAFMISRFVAVNETEQKVALLEKQLAEEESITSQMVFDMEQSVDLGKIEKEATTRLGMQRPEKYQTIYVNVKQDDMTEKTALEVEGPGRRMWSAIKKLCGHIVNFFSIK